MIRKYLSIAFLVLIIPIAAFGQRKKVRIDSLTIRTYIDVGGSNDVATFLKDYISNNLVLSIGLGDTSVSTEKIKDAAITAVLIEDSTITLAKFTTTAYNLISTGVAVTNNADDYTTKTSGSNIYVANPFGNIDTLTQNSATPSVAGGPYFRTNNTSATSITDFTDDLSSSQTLVFFVEVRDDSTSFIHDGTNLDLGGHHFGAKTGDFLKWHWTGTKYRLLEVKLN